MLIRATLNGLTGRVVAHGPRFVLPWSRGSASLQFRAEFKQISKLNYSTGVPRVSEMFHWGFAPPERLKTTGLEKSKQ